MLRILTAAAMATVLLGAAVPASAADYYPYEGYSDYSSSYAGESDYSDYDYGDEGPTYYGPPPAPGSLDDFGSPGVTRGYKHRKHKHRLACRDVAQVKQSLADQGWKKLRGIRTGGGVVGVTASRPDGLTYRLRVDRCSGVILTAKLLNFPGGGPAYSSGEYLPSY